MKLYDLFYDRKKGKYRRLRKPIPSIISIKSLAQATMSALLQRPDEARGRPGSLLGDIDQYGKLFDEKYDSNLYVTCILIDRQVNEFIDGILLDGHSLTKDEKRNIRYYVDYLLACELTKKQTPNESDLAKILSLCVAGISNEMLQKATEKVLDLYKSLGGTDKVAKGKDLLSSLSALIVMEYPA